MKTKLTDEWGSFSAIPNEFIDHAHGLSDQARWLFVLLRRYTNAQTNTAFPSYRTIQAETGWTPKTIAAAVRDLEASGWLERRKSFGAPTEYKLLRRHFPQGSNDTSHREVRHFPQGSKALPVGKSIKKEERKKKDHAVLPIEIYAEIAGRQLSIREEELIESKIAAGEAEAFRDWLTGWAASYGTKGVFNVLEAYGKQRSSQGASYTPKPGDLESVLAFLSDPDGGPRTPVETGERAHSDRDLAGDPGQSPNLDSYFLRQAAQRGT